MKSITRRSFVQHTLGAGMGAALVSVPGFSRDRTLPQRPGAAEPLKISVLSYSFHGLLRAGAIDLFGYLESCRFRYGLRAADLWNGFLTSTDAEYLDKVRRGLEDRELDLADLAVDLAHVWSDNPEERDRNHRNALAHLEAARVLGARFVRIDAGGAGEEWTNEQFDFIAERYREYVRFASDHGFRMGAENHWGPETRWENLRRLIEAVDSPAFGFSCHIGGWAGDEEEKRRADRESAPWVAHTHIDWRTCTGPLLEEKLANLWRAGYQGYYSVEHHSAENEYAAVDAQLGLVRRQLEIFRDKGLSG